MIDTQPITRRRGDTFRIRIEFTQQDGTPLPLDGTFLLGVTEQSAPDDDDVPVMLLVGSIIGSMDDGILHFPMTAEDADHVGELFYEVENTTSAGKTRTILEGPFTMTQDRVKGNPGYVWTPDGITGARWTDWADASGPFRGWFDCNDDTENWFEYQIRDGVPVVRWSGAQTGTWFTFEFAGDLNVGGAWGPRGIWEFTVLVYWHPGVDLLMGSDLYDICHTLMSAQADRIRLECESYHSYGWDDSSENTNFYHTDRTVEEWVAIRYRIDCDTPQVSGKVWYPADPINWEADEPASWNGQVGLATAPLRTVLPVRFRFDGGSAATACDIALVGWERIG